MVRVLSGGRRYCQRTKDLVHAWFGGGQADRVTGYFWDISGQGYANLSRNMPTQVLSPLVVSTPRPREKQVAGCVLHRSGYSHSHFLKECLPILCHQSGKGCFDTEEEWNSVLIRSLFWDAIISLGLLICMVCWSQNCFVVLLREICSNMNPRTNSSRQSDILIN